MTRELAGSRGAGKYVAHLMGGRVRQLDGSAAGSDSEESEDEEEDEEEYDDTPRARRSEGGGGFEDAETTARKRARRANVMSGPRREVSACPRTPSTRSSSCTGDAPWASRGMTSARSCPDARSARSQVLLRHAEEKMGGDPSAVPNFHDAEKRAMKTACGEAQARRRGPGLRARGGGGERARRELVDETRSRELCAEKRGRRRDLLQAAHGGEPRGGRVRAGVRVGARGRRRDGG